MLLYYINTNLVKKVMMKKGWEPLTYSITMEKCICMISNIVIQ